MGLCKRNGPCLVFLCFSLGYIAAVFPFILIGLDMHQRTRSRQGATASPRTPSSNQSSDIPKKRSRSEAGESSRCRSSEKVSFLPKEPRYEEGRRTFEETLMENPEWFELPTNPYSSQFVTEAAYERYLKFSEKKFINPQFLPLDVEKLQTVKDVVVHSGMIYTVLDVGPYVPDLVWEFMANLEEAKVLPHGVAVYVRGAMYEVSPSIIDLMSVLSPGDPHYDMYAENLDTVVTFLTEGRQKRWEGMCSKLLTADNQVLYKLCCTNWMPTMNYTRMHPDRLRFLYALHHNKRADFGILVYDQLMDMAHSAGDTKRRIGFPSLIHQLLHFQRVVPRREMDEELSGHPTALVKDGKAGRGIGGVVKPPNLVDDLQQVINDLRAIQLRSRRGEYGEGPVHIIDSSDEEE